MHVSITYHYQNNIITEASVFCEQVSLDCSAETKTSSSSTSSLTFCQSRMWCALLLLLCLAMANKRTGRHQIALTIQMCNLCRLTSSPGSGLRWQTMTSTIWCVWQLFIVPQTERKLLQTDRTDAFAGYAGHLSGCPSQCHYIAIMRATPMAVPNTIFAD